MEPDVTKRDIEIALICLDMDRVSPMGSPVVKEGKPLVQSVRQCFSRKGYKALGLDEVMPQPVQDAYKKFLQFLEEYMSLPVQVKNEVHYSH